MNEKQREAGDKALTACVYTGFYKILGEWEKIRGNDLCADILLKSSMEQGLEIFKLIPAITPEDIDTISGTLKLVDDIVAALKKRRPDPSMN